MVSVAKDFTIKDLRGLFIEANLLDKRSIIGAKQSYDIGKEKVHLSFTVEVIGDSDIYQTISNQFVNIQCTARWKIEHHPTDGGIEHLRSYFAAPRKVPGK